MSLDEDRAFLEVTPRGPAKSTFRAVPFRVNGLTHVYRCARTVPKHIELELLWLALSEKQIPQIVEDNESGTERIEPLGRGCAQGRCAARLLGVCWGITRGFSAGRFENHLVGGAARFWRRGGLPPTPAFPRGKRERGEILQLRFLPGGGRSTKSGTPLSSLASERIRGP